MVLLSFKLRSKAAALEKLSSPLSLLPRTLQQYSFSHLVNLLSQWETYIHTQSTVSLSPSFSLLKIPGISNKNIFPQSFT